MLLIREECFLMMFTALAEPRQTPLHILQRPILTLLMGQRAHLDLDGKALALDSSECLPGPPKFPKVQCSLFEGTHLGLEQCAAVIGRSKEEPAEAGPDHEEERRPPTRPRGQHCDG